MRAHLRSSGRSRMTLCGSFSSSMPLYAAWRTRPSPVQPANSARMTSSGRSHFAFRAAARGSGAGERRRVGGERRDGGQEFGRLLVGEARPRPCRRSAARRPRRRRRGAHRGRAPCRCPSPAADDELLLGPDLDLLPAIARFPGTYAERRSLAMIPSRPRVRAASKNAIPPPRRVRSAGPADPVAGPSPRSPRVLERLVEQRPAVEVEQVEDLVHERVRLGGPPLPLIRAWSRAKSGSPRLSSAITSPSTIASRAPIQVGGSRNGPKYRGASCSPRVQSRTLSPSTTASTRNPSHLTSNSQPGSSNGAATRSRASAGRSGFVALTPVFPVAVMGRCCIVAVVETYVATATSSRTVGISSRPRPRCRPLVSIAGTVSSPYAGRRPR